MPTSTVYKYLLVTALMAAASLLGGDLWSAAQPDRGRPNIIIIHADDLGVNDLGVYGRKDHRTPHLDRLAAEGMRFTSAYCAQPICSPSRAALLTGKAPARLHLTTYLPGRPDARSQKLLHPKIRQELPLEEQTLAEALRGAGYATAAIGKWHLGGKDFGPDKQGFEVVFAGRANTPPSAEEGGKGEYELTAQAEKFITDHRDRPFFLYLAHNNPHIPLAAQPDRVAKNRDAFNPVYAAVIDTLDDRVGRLLARLDGLGLRQNTIVVFTSDNGGLHVPEGRDDPPTHNTPFRAGKGFLYEGGLRVPLLIRWPDRIKAGAVAAVPVVNTDLMSTLLELAGVRPPRGLDGASYARWLTGGAKPPARPLFWHFPHYTNQGSRPGGAVRQGDWKLIEHYEDGRLELFHLGRDPGEAQDLSAREPGRTAALRKRLAVWRKSVGAQENTPNPDFDPALHRRIYLDTDVSKLTPARTAAEMTGKLAAWRQGMDSVRPRRAAARPNVLLILADDLGFSDLGSYGSEVATPNLDRLAAGGLRFSQFYNAARCCPTRAALLSGLYPHQAGVGHMLQNWRPPGYTDGLNDQSVTVAELLRQAGYRTYQVGKWHVGGFGNTPKHNFPLDRGFDRFYGTGGGGNYFTPRPLFLDRQEVQPGDDYYFTDALSEQAARFVEEHRRGHPDQPFFLHLCYTAPHFPLHARPEDIAKYRGRYRVGWDALRQRRFARQKELGIVDARWRLSPRDPVAPPWTEADDKDQWDLRMAVHAAMVDRMDQGIGRVLDAVRRIGADQNTLVLFLSDNGASAEALDSWPNPARGHQPGAPVGTRESHRCVEVGWANAANTPFREHKMWVHEGGISTPLIAHWPAGIPESRRGQLETQLALVNLGCIAVHVWNSRYRAPRLPDWLCFDLDPSSGQFADAARAGLIVKEALDALSLRSFPKTSGARGLHVFVPLRVELDEDMVTRFAAKLGERLAAAFPNELTVVHRVADRGDRVYLDSYRNAFAQTVVAPYSVRRQPGAPVSTPLAWREVQPDLDPSQFNIASVGARVLHHDPWRDFFRSRQSLRRALRAVGRL